MDSHGSNKRRTIEESKAVDERKATTNSREGRHERKRSEKGHRKKAEQDRNMSN